MGKRKSRPLAVEEMREVSVFVSLMDVNDDVGPASPSVAT